MCNGVKAKVVSEDVGVKVNNAKTWVAWEYSLACLRPKLRKKCLWVKGSRWGKCIKFGLATKVWAYKFSWLLAKKCLNWTHISLCHVALPQAGKTRHHWGNMNSKCQIATS